MSDSETMGNKFCRDVSEVDDRKSRQHRVVEGEEAVESNTVATSKDGGEKKVNQYVIKKLLGKGSYGKVKLALNTDNNKLYAIKILNKSFLKKKRIGMSNALQDVKREVAIMKKLSHENIVKMHEIIDDPDHNKMYMVLDYVEGGPIMSGEKGQKPIKENRCRPLFQDMLLGLEYLHFQKVIHRDLKPENILVDSKNSVRITDFGVSHMFDDTDEMRKTAGSPAFMAPETATGQSFKGKPVDIYALGITLYMMAFGTVPFKSDDIMELYEQIKNDKVEIPSSPQVSDDMVDCILAMLEKDPEERITLKELKEHRWVTNGGKDELPELVVERIHVDDDDVDRAFTKAHTIYMIAKIKSKMGKAADRARKAAAAEQSNLLEGESDSESQSQSVS